MKDIVVTKGAKSEFGSLVPNYNKESSILEVSSEKRKKWIYGFDVDGNIVFDVDENFVIENFDVLISKALWSKCENISKPNFFDEGSIVVKKQTLNQKSFSMPNLKIFFDSKAKEVLILFNEDDFKKIPDFLGVKTSISCLGLLEMNSLRGFIIYLDKQ